LVNRRSVYSCGSFDVARYVREQMAAQRAMGFDEDGLKIATGATKAQEVEIQMLDDEDEDEKKKERLKTAEEKRRQNIMPSWHTNSTISGEKTALGIQEEERSNNNALLAALDAQNRAAEAQRRGNDTVGKWHIKYLYLRLITLQILRSITIN
jgi:hypothetical protein